MQHALPTAEADSYSFSMPCPKSPLQPTVQDKAGESAMQAVNTLGSMFEWLLQPVRSDEVEQPMPPSTATAGGQPAQAVEVRA